jgi:hypothetical protein
MKFLEGKTPAERNKIVAACVLGFLALLSLGYTFLSSGSSTKKKTITNGNANLIVKNASPNPNVNNGDRISTPEQVCAEDPFCGLTMLPENPFPPVYGDAPSRNIFALYEPPPPAPPKPSPMPSPIPIPSPTPPPFIITAANPSTNPVYAQQGDFTLEIFGDKFPADARILFNGIEVPTQYGGANRLTAQINASLVATPGQRQIVVRTPDGKMSNVAALEVAAPPVPNYNFVGLVARKRFNNDTAVLQDKTSKELQNVRLGSTLGRFKVVSISSKAVVLQDTTLAFNRHSLPFADEKSAARSGGATSTNPPPNNLPPEFNVYNQQPLQQCPPGIPCQGQIQSQPQPLQKNPNDDEDDNNPN